MLKKIFRDRLNEYHTLKEGDKVIVKRYDDNYFSFYPNEPIFGEIDQIIKIESEEDTKDKEDKEDKKDKKEVSKFIDIFYISFTNEIYLNILQSGWKIIYNNQQRLYEESFDINKINSILISRVGFNIISLLKSRIPKLSELLVVPKTPTSLKSINSEKITNDKKFFNQQNQQN